MDEGGRWVARSPARCLYAWIDLAVVQTFTSAPGSRTWRWPSTTRLQRRSWTRTSKRASTATSASSSTETWGRSTRRSCPPTSPRRAPSTTTSPLPAGPGPTSPWSAPIPPAPAPALCVCMCACLLHASPAKAWNPCTTQWWRFLRHILARPLPRGRPTALRGPGRPARPARRSPARRATLGHARHPSAKGQQQPGGSFQQPLQPVLRHVFLLCQRASRPGPGPGPGRGAGPARGAHRGHPGRCHGHHAHVLGTTGQTTIPCASPRHTCVRRSSRDATKKAT